MIYDRPEQPVPIYVAAGGPMVARFAGRFGDGFICTSGKGMELYTDKLIPAVEEGAEKADRDAAGIDRMIEIKISYDRDPDAARENTRFWRRCRSPRSRRTRWTPRGRWSASPTSCRSSRS